WNPGCITRCSTAIAAGRVPERAGPLGGTIVCQRPPPELSPAGGVDFPSRNDHEAEPMKRYLLASDFDQTLSFNDSGIVLSELLGISDFREKTAGLSHIHLVQQGAELAYLLLHDPEYRRVRKEHPLDVVKRVRLKQNLSLLPRLLRVRDGYEIDFYVNSSAPQEVIQS